jgi:lanthanide-dependent methanol dehydrogenase
VTHRLGAFLAALGSGLVCIPVPVSADDWPMAAKDYANTRYSGLNQVTTANAKGLKLAWKFDTGIHRGQEAAPIVARTTVFVVTPWPNVLYAFDLTKPGPAVRWKYEPKPAALAKGVACCDTVNRGAVFADGRVFMTTLDGHACGADAASGKELWKTKVEDINIAETLTMSPLVVKGKVLVGNSGGEFDVRGWLKALDAASGKVAWDVRGVRPRP